MYKKNTTMLTFIKIAPNSVFKQSKCLIFKLATTIHTLQHL